MLHSEEWVANEDWVAILLSVRRVGPQYEDVYAKPDTISPLTVKVSIFSKFLKFVLQFRIFTIWHCTNKPHASSAHTLQEKYSE